MDYSDEHEVIRIEQPPRTVGGVIRRLGPGLIVAGSIVGSGELIATTKTGAEAGFWLLWLILIGCVIKVFVQIEFGRYSITSGKTTMDALNEVPGPRIGRHGNWIVWYWFLMFFGSIGQLGGIVGGVGQALAISMPLTQAGRDFNEYVDAATQLRVTEAQLSNDARRSQMTATELAALSETAQQLQRELAEADRQWISRLGEERFAELGNRPPPSPDDKLWAALVAVITSGLLMRGRYGFIQSFSTVLVSAFTLITVVNVAALQSDPSWRVTWEELVRGLSFRMPPDQAGNGALATALATFGIIGVGASELVTYPYWCLEKGYARFTGRWDKSPEWADRARGWMRVMHWDAWCSMVIYTLATAAFYLLGAAILGRTGLNPAKSDMVRTLAVMYEPVFTDWAAMLFLFGAFAVLYSTYFVANASHARVFSDVVGVLGFASRQEAAHAGRVRLLSGLFPLVCLAIYVAFPQPTRLVLLGALMQAIMLPMLALAGLFFRYRRIDARLRPGPVWDAFLWISAVGMMIAGIWALVTNLQG